jgi:hypothetical protein
MTEPSLSGWGRLRSLAKASIQDLDALTRDAVLTRGLGRSYGDSSSHRRVIRSSSRHHSRIGFCHSMSARACCAPKPAIRCKACITTFCRVVGSPITPARFVTLGSMVAADIRGKIIVDGTIGRHVRAIRLRVASGDIVECSGHGPISSLATIGGMGSPGT